MAVPAACPRTSSTGRCSRRGRAGPVLSFPAFFQAATGHQPDGDQARIARDGLPDLVRAPAGDGKSGVVLAWLWRRLHGPDQAGTPRRLLYVLPPRSLAEPLAGRLRTWLANLELTEEVALHLVRGAASDNSGDWREDMHQPAILLGEADLLVSKALNRGYGTGYPVLPIDFALTGNGARWLVDEPARSPRAAATLRQLAGLAAGLGTAEPFAVTFLTGLTTGPDGSPAIAARLAATRTIRRAPVSPGDYPALAAFTRAAHRPGTLTLVVLDEVPAAQWVYRLLREHPVSCLLLHAQFRGVDRAPRLARLAAAPAGLIVVAAGEAAAGLDLDVALVVTEPAPARTRPPGLTPPLGPVPPPGPTSPPGPAPPLDPASPLDPAPPLDRAGLLALFDTAPAGDPGHDGGAERYLRDVGEPDVEVAWVTWTAGAGRAPDREAGAPDPEVRYPAPEYRCRVSVSDARVLAAGRPAWWFDRAAVEWHRAGPRTPLAPCDLVLVDAADGGYDPETGFDPSAAGPVPGSPEALTPDELAEREAESAAAAASPGEPAPPLAPRPWQSLDEHSEQVRDQAAALLETLSPKVPPAAARATVVAGYLHDAGKAHPVWQDALCALAAGPDAARVNAGRPWAKSGTAGRLEFAGGVPFRHELASLLLIEGPLRPLLAQSPDPDLTRYLVLAHHGLLRAQVRDPRPRPGRPPPDRELLGLRDGAATPVPPLLGRPGTILTVDLDQFFPGGARSWTATVSDLLDRYGPFVLSYLEAIVRIADWRASGGRSLPERPR